MLTKSTMKDHLVSLANNFRRRAATADHVHLVVVAVVIGLLGGLSAVGFRALIEAVNLAAWHRAQYTLEYIRQLPIWWKIAAPMLGGAVVGFIVNRFAHEAKGHGVPEVMEAVALQGGRMRPRVVLAKMFASAISIGSGGSVGREGPIVQIGSALGSSVGQWLRVDEERLRTFVGCGAAAGIAATFNAPIAGALFSAEIILGSFGVAHFSPIVISSVAGTVVSRYFLGDFPAFVVPVYRLVHPLELLAYTVLGLLAALVAIAFIRTLYGIEDVFERAPLGAVPRAMLGGALVGTIGLLAPEVFGVGYEAINQALNGTMVWWLMLALIGAKIIAVSITIGSGGSGGVFAPSLFIGAMLGGGVGVVVHSLWPASTGTPGAYALVGMGAVVAGATHAPITAILIIFELTADYEIILPLMISTIIATLLATRLQSASIYTLKLLRRGTDLRRGRAFDVLADIPVTDAMAGDVYAVRPNTDLQTLLDRFATGEESAAYVVDDDGTLMGRIDAKVLRAAMADSLALSDVIIAQDLLTDRDDPRLSPTDTLAEAMQLLADHDEEITVVRDDKLMGVLRSRDVITRYNAELFSRDMARTMATAIAKGSAVPVQAVKGAQVEEMAVPQDFVGHSLRDLDVRRRHGVTVLVVKHADGAVTPSPGADFVFTAGDILLTLGTADARRPNADGATAL